MREERRLHQKAGSLFSVRRDSARLCTGQFRGRFQKARDGGRSDATRTLSTWNRRSSGKSCER